jgi:hypothetical protein
MYVTIFLADISKFSVADHPQPKDQKRAGSSGGSARAGLDRDPVAACEVFLAPLRCVSEADRLLRSKNGLEP